MKPSTAFLAVCIVAAGAPAEAQDTPLVLAGATLFDGTGAAPVPNARIVVRGEQIVCAGTRNACAAPEGAKVADLPSGSWVLPGLVDAHVHFAQTGWFEGRPDTLDLRDLHPFDVTEAQLKSNPGRYYRSYLCSGVTSVFDVGGFPWSWELRASAEHDPMSPHVAAAGPLITHAPRAKLNLPGEQEMILLSDEEAGRAAVRYMASRATDAIKIWFLRVREGEREDIDGRVIAVADEARRENLPLIVHATSLREAKVVLREGVHLLVHGVYDQLVDEEFLTLAKEAGTIYTPTLIVSDGYLNSRVAKYDKHGNWITSWGSYGTEPGQFRLPHNMQADREGNVYVADRSNRRIQVFDADGNFQRIILLNAPFDKTQQPILGNLNPDLPDETQPWTLCISTGETQYLWASDQHPGRIYELSLDGKILGMLGGAGKQLG